MGNTTLRLGRRNGTLVTQIEQEGPALRAEKEFPNNNGLKACAKYCITELDGQVVFTPYVADNVTPLEPRELRFFQSYLSTYKKDLAMSA